MVPEEIRTPDPQSRSVYYYFDLAIFLQPGRQSRIARTHR